MVKGPLGPPSIVSRKRLGIEDVRVREGWFCSPHGCCCQNQSRGQAAGPERLLLHSGVVAEWSKAAGLGPVLFGGVGSNPTDIKVMHECSLISAWLPHDVLVPRPTTTGGNRNRGPGMARNLLTLSIARREATIEGPNELFTPNPKGPTYHARRIPSSKGEHVRTSAGTNGHTRSAFVAHTPHHPPLHIMLQDDFHPSLMIKGTTVTQCCSMACYVLCLMMDGIGCVPFPSQAPTGMHTPWVVVETILMGRRVAHRPEEGNTAAAPHVHMGHAGGGGLWRGPYCGCAWGSLRNVSESEMFCPAHNCGILPSGVLSC